MQLVYAVSYPETLHPSLQGSSKASYVSHLPSAADARMPCLSPRALRMCSHSPAAITRSARHLWSTGMLRQQLNRLRLVCRNGTSKKTACGRACTSLPEQLIFSLCWQACAVCVRTVIHSVQACSGRFLAAQKSLLVCLGAKAAPYTCKMCSAGSSAAGLISHLHLQCGSISACV
jgi:hypothetical protein